MKTDSFHCPAAGRNFLLFLLLAWLALPGRAQFAPTAEQTTFACNVARDQTTVQAVADGAGGSLVVWIDKRFGNNTGAGTCLYAQHLDAAGTPTLTLNGLRLYQTKGREIWDMRAVAWNGGLLVAWVQGGFTIGGDTISCQLYDLAGVPQWKQPTLMATRTSAAHFLGSDTFTVMPTSAGGATIAYDGGNYVMGFNQVSKTGALRWALNSQNQQVEGANYFDTVGDGSDGFYLVGYTGTFGAPLVAQRFGADGKVRWPIATSIAAGGSSARRGDWKLFTDSAKALYVAWVSNNNDPLAAKVLPGGELAWASPGYVSLCTYGSNQTYPYAIWHDNALWMAWADDRVNNINHNCYAQKVDASGKLAWDASGVPVYAPPTDYMMPKLAASDNGSVMVFFNANFGAAFAAQKLLPTGAQAFPAAGLPLSTVRNDRPYYDDFALVSEPNGSVQAYWSTQGAVATTGRDIAYGRMQRTGTLLGTEATATRLGFAAYPNPAHGELRLQLPTGVVATDLRLYDAQGRLVSAFAPAARLPLPALAPGLYMLRATLAGQPVSQRVAVE